MPRCLLLLASALVPIAAQAQEAEAARERGLLTSTATDEIVVTGRREATSLAETPRAIRVIEEETIDFYARQSGNLSETLGKLVPGFGLPVFQNSLRSLTLRGREALLLFDGVPLQSNSGFFAELGAVDPATVGRVEVLYGPTALYGRGATGGIIQFFTRDAGPDGWSGDATLTGRGDLGGRVLGSDTMSARAAGGLSLRQGSFDAVARFAVERLNGSFQPDGQRIAPTNIDESDRWSLFAKLGYGDAGTGRVEGWVLKTRSTVRNFDIRSQLRDNVAIGVPVDRPVSYAFAPSQDTLAASLRFRHDDLFGLRMNLQAYHRDSAFVQVASDIRALPLPPAFPRLFQTNLDTNEQGARADIAIPVTEGLEISFGGDWSTQFNARPLLVSSVPVFVADGLFDGSIETVQTPRFDLDSLGGFAQASWKLRPGLTLTGGLRWDRFYYDVAPYDVLFGLRGPRPGGQGRASGVSWNLGATYDVAPGHNLFASYAQGFSIPELGFAANSIRPGVPISGSAFVAPILVESFEAGLRGGRGALRYSVAGFYARSDNGASTTVNPSTGIADLIRAPQRNYGFEASIDVAPTRRFDAALAIGWNDGENDANNDGTFLPLGSVQTPPLTLSITNAWRPVDRLELTGQLLFAGDRDRARTARVDPFALQSYTTVDFGASYDLGWGKVALNITNLLNSFYLPVESQSRFGTTADRRLAGPGRLGALTFSAAF
jgi:iron complex outermembrane receptor protein